MVTQYQAQIDINKHDVLDQIPMHIYWLDLQNIILGINQVQATFLGKNKEKIIGQHLSSFVKEPMLNEIIKNNKEVIETNQVIVCVENVLNTDGHIRKFLSQKGPLLNEQGCIIGILGLSHDITHSDTPSPSFDDLKTIKQLSQKITGVRLKDYSSISDYFLKIRNHFEKIIGLMPGHVYWVNQEGTILGCNDRQANSFGYPSRHQLYGKSYYDLLPKDEAEKLVKTNRKVLIENQTLTIEEQGTMSDGVIHTYFSQKTPIRNEDNQAIGVLSTSVDITLLKKVEEDLTTARHEAETANSAKSEFLMNISHDLRTPCSGILAVANILADQELAPEVKTKINYIAQSSEHLLKLLNEIIDFTKVETKKFTAETKIFDLYSLITDVYQLMLPEINNKNIKFDIVYSDKLAKIYVGDATILHRILLNLIGNAAKFTEQGYIKVIVTTSKQDQIEISVQDSGIGIKPENIDLIFDPFTRETLSYRGLYKGTGLGLSIVKKLIHKISGEVTVTSQVGVGSVFYCTLPLPAHDNQQEKILEKTDRLPSLNLLGLKGGTVKHALIIEDDMLSQKVTEYFLAQYNCITKTVTNGHAALSEDLSQYDFLFLDIGLPDINGLELAQKIRAHEQTHNIKRKPIIGLTAHADTKALNINDCSSIDHIVQKPLTKEILENL